jgi:hypothetical protein
MSSQASVELSLGLILPVIALVDVALAVAVVLLLNLPLWSLAIVIPLAWTDTLLVAFILRRAGRRYNRDQP